MIKTKLIVARSQNGIIGKDNTIPWDIPADMKLFRKLTSHRAIVMGRKTFESLGRVLPYRLNIVVTSQDFEPSLDPNLRYVKSLREARELAAGLDYEELWVIGGERLYKEAMTIVDELYITEVLLTISYTVNDVVAKFNPDIDPLRWNKVEHLANTGDGVGYDFTRYVRVRHTPNKDARSIPVLID